MALQIKQQLRQIQQLVMTPQLQQAIKLLQYNHLEMIGALEQELKENPMLEIGSYEEPLMSQDEPFRNDLGSLEEMVAEPKKPESDFLDVDWENYLESYGADYQPKQREFSELNPLENMTTYKTNLFRYLLEQLQFSRVEGLDREIALEIIGNITDQGYLDIEIEEIAQNLNSPIKEVERVLGMVQEFEPRGVGARDLKECLMIQARYMDDYDYNVINILENAFDLLQQGKFDLIAKKLKISMEETQTAAKLISKFEPKPGRPFMGTETVYVQPDIFIFKTGRDYSVVVNDDGLPRLKISAMFQRELYNGSSNPKAKEYIQEKMRSAIWLIKSIHQRQRTIYKTTKSIIKFQREFFDKGIDYLKPLVLKDVADDIEMHESTISRVTTNKYVHTPRGVFELKFFFNAGIKHGTEAIASESVKNQIMKFVKGEDPKKPFSDKEIADHLAKSQIMIARRTVAKYRDMLGIPPSSKRRKKF